MKKTWEVINELIRKKGNKPLLPTSFLHRGKYINNPDKIADNFRNDHFCNIGANSFKKNLIKFLQIMKNI
jgi:hypothetical protein